LQPVPERRAIRQGSYPDRRDFVSEYRETRSPNQASRVPRYRERQKILLIDSASVCAEILRRDGDRWITELVQDREAMIRLSSVDLRVAMAEPYEGIDFDADDAA
jgi:hypothetical protein